MQRFAELTTWQLKKAASDKQADLQLLVENTPRLNQAAQTISEQIAITRAKMGHLNLQHLAKVRAL